MAEPFLPTLAALRAAAEPTRLRLLALLARGELTVGEICEILGQSQPRISRHLKVLTDAGLLDRFREQNWVYYRAPSTGILARDRPDARPGFAVSIRPARCSAAMPRGSFN